MKAYDWLHGPQCPPPPDTWLTIALERIDRLSACSSADDSRKAMARRICLAAEIDDPRFPPPVARQVCGQVLLHWSHEMQPGVGSRLDVIVTHGNSFRGIAWYPGCIGQATVVNRDHDEHARRMFDEFWPAANATTVDDIMKLLTVDRPSR